MPTLTIQKETMKKEDNLILVPSNEYKAFLQWRKYEIERRASKTY